MKSKKMIHNDIHGTETLLKFQKANKYNEWIIEQVKPFLAGIKVLEIGCGLGNITKLLKNDFDMTGVDIRQDYVDYIENILHVRTKCCDLSKNPHFNEEFDAAFSLNVLEHIENHKQMLLNTNKALKPGGNLVILVPAFNWLYGTFDKAIFHKRRYTRKSLKNILELAGFKVNKTFYFNAFGIPGWFLCNRILKKKDLPEGQLNLFNTLVPLFKILDKPFHPFFGISVIAYAKKQK